jgi:hypothetical protein
MLSFLGFGRSAAGKEEATVPAALQAAPPPIAPNNDKQREVIRLALNGILRRHGIASTWLGCEVGHFAHAGGADALLIQLTILKWHDGLVLYAPDLQKELFNAMRLFDHTIVIDDFVFAWKFSPDCGYANGKLPGADFWSDTRLPVAPVVPVAAAVVAAKFDLPPSPLDDEDDDDNGFAPTQMHSNF